MNTKVFNLVLEHTIKQKSKLWVQLCSHSSQKCLPFTGYILVALSMQTGVLSISHGKMHIP